MPPSPPILRLRWFDLHDTMRFSIDDLYDELLIEVLCRIPLKYLTQCKCVSKRWFSLISSPGFASQFVRYRLSNKENEQQPWTFIYYRYVTSMKNLNPPRLTSRDTVFKSPVFSLSFLPCYQPQQATPIYVLKTFNDLVLCCGEMLRQTTYYIANPLTKQWLALPPPPACHAKVIVEFICEPYYQEDQRQPYNLVLNDQYKFKVVRIPHPSNLCNMNKLKFEIFSSQTGQWNKTQVILQPDAFKIGIIDHHVFCNGKLTLLTAGLHGLRTIIVGDQFDKCRVVSIPGSRSYETLSVHSSWRLFSCQGHLRVAIVSVATDIPASPILRIWELKDCNDVGEWLLVHQISFERMATRKLLSRFFLRRTYYKDVTFIPIVLGFHPHDMNVLYLNLNCDGISATYNMQNRSFSYFFKGHLPQFIHHRVHQLKIPLWPTPMPKVSHHHQSDSSNRELNQ